MFDNIKKFIKKKKLDKQFKEAGQGYTLAGDGPVPPWRQPQARNQQQQPSGSNTVPAAPKNPTRPDVNKLAEAAERRIAQGQTTKLTPMQRMIQEQARKELEEEQRRLQAEQPKTDGQQQGMGQQAEKPKKQPKVLYTCELFDEDVALPKSEMMAYLAGCLAAMLTDEEHQADVENTAVTMIYSVNKEDVRKPALETMQKYLQNILDKPDDPKFRRIRMTNKHFQDVIAPCKGAVEFLQAVGFKIREEKQQQNGGGMEKFLVMEAVDFQRIRNMQTLLADGKPIAIRVFRDRKVFQIDPLRPISQPEIPDEFFMLTVEELRREQQLRTEALEKMTTMRTAKMREMDEAKEKMPKHKYTYIRVRFPNNYVIQGIFNVFEKFQAVREFVHKNLAVDYGTFTFNGGTSDDKTLLDLQLVPAALIHFQWDEATMNHFKQNGFDPIPYLSEQLERDAEPMP